MPSDPNEQPAEKGFLSKLMVLVRNTVRVRDPGDFDTYVNILAVRLLLFSCLLLQVSVVAFSLDDYWVYRDRPELLAALTQWKVFGVCLATLVWPFRATLERHPYLFRGLLAALLWSTHFVGYFLARRVGGFESPVFSVTLITLGFSILITLPLAFRFLLNLGSFMAATLGYSAFHVNQLSDHATAMAVQISMAGMFISTAVGHIVYVLVRENYYQRQHMAALKAEIELRNESLEHEVALRTEEVQRANIALELAQENERRKLARELHDELGHRLTLLRQSIDSLARKKGNDLGSIGEQVGEIERVARHTVSSFATHFDGRYPIHQALESMGQTIRQSGGPEVEWVIEPDRLDLSKSMIASVLRIVQEATTNALKHAEASKITISLLKQEQEVHLNFHDDGRGFDPENATSGMGLRGMRERTAYLGGTFQLESGRGHGTEITIAIPLKGKQAVVGEAL